MLNLSQAASFGLTLLLMVASPAAHCYEEDFHFGLTLWLAQQAGFSMEDALVIAQADLEYDHSALNAPHLVAFYACLSQDRAMSQLVKELHFPGDGPVPGDPAEREVFPGSEAALRATQDRITTPIRNQTEGLKKFGQGMHPLQDSWAHQGIPDTPLGFLCDRKLLWGHPKIRGGWQTHAADLTYLYPIDAVKAAEKTFSTLCEYRRASAGKVCVSKFSDLARNVRIFAGTETKDQKAAWFRANGVSDLGFLDFITLRDGHGSWRLSDSARRAGRGEKIKWPSGSEGDFLRNFISAWMNSGDMLSVANLVFAPPSEQDRMAPLGTSIDSDVQTFAKTLALWRARDHGSVASELHRLKDTPDRIGTTGSRVPGGAFTPSVRRPVLAIRVAAAPDGAMNPFAVGEAYSSADDAVIGDNAGNGVVLVKASASNGLGLNIGVLRLRHAPHDYVVIAFRKHERGFKVESIESIVAQ